MSFRLFDQGYTASQIQSMRQPSADDMAWEKECNHSESERVLNILRKVQARGLVPSRTGNKIEGKTNPASMSKRAHDLLCWTPYESSAVSEETNRPNKWFAAKFPKQTELYGPAFMEVTLSDADKLDRIIPVYPNNDLFAAILGGDPDLGHQVLWYPPEATFYFFDSKVNAFCPTSEDKLKLLVSNYLIRCSQDCSSLVDGTNLFVRFRQDEVLGRIVTKAKALLEADRSFFDGKDGQRRYVEGRYIEPDEEPAYRTFVKQTVIKEPAGKITVNAAFHRYYEFCRAHDQLPLTRHEFKGLVAEVIREQFNVGLRHDVPGETGKASHGWLGVRFHEELSYGHN